MRLSIFAILFLISTGASGAKPAPRIQFKIVDILGGPKPSGSAFLSDSVLIRVEGLAPNANVNLRLTMDSNQSEAVFMADSSGAVDLSKQAPLSGAYTGVDAGGLVWSMRPNGHTESGSLNFRLDVIQEKTTLASADLPRNFPAAGVSGSIVNGHGFIGQIFLPPGAGPFPTLIVLGGGEGGLSGAAFLAAYYASFGYASLAVAYFGLDGLPSGVDRIPMEYFKKSIDWVRAQPFAKGRRLGIIGGSRGAEAALAVASTFDAFDAVVSDVGNALPVSGYDFTTGQEISPWTYQGKDLPFQKNLLFGRETYRSHPNGVRAFEFKSTRNWDILNKPEAIQAAILPVEKIKAPILFNAAADDALWPSSPLSKVGFQRRVEHNVSARDEFYEYINVGHVLGTPPGMPSQETYFLFPDGRNEYWELGGTARNNAHARLLSTQRNLRFLAKHLRP